MNLEINLYNNRQYLWKMFGWTKYKEYFCYKIMT